MEKVELILFTKKKSIRVEKSYQLKSTCEVNVNTGMRGKTSPTVLILY